MRKRNRIWRVAVPLVILAILAGAFWYGGAAPGLQGWHAGDIVETSGSPALASLVPEAPEQEDAPNSESPDTTKPPATEPVVASTSPTPTSAPAPTPTPAVPSPTMNIDPSTGMDPYLTDPVPEGQPLPVEPQSVTIGTAAYTCTISISCSTILEHMDWLAADKAELVPEDGWILAPTTVTFYEGESVFNVLQRVCKQQGIHMEFTDTPVYNSAYIEGIGNLYEFDCGEMSGWMYQVNGWFPNYGCSRYSLQDGDTIAWVYTCDLGYDVGGGYATGG